MVRDVLPVKIQYNILTRINRYYIGDTIGVYISK
nr:MAG TPA: hypothetical protein [Caudoviricetes sp.]